MPTTPPLTTVHQASFASLVSLHICSYGDAKHVSALIWHLLRPAMSTSQLVKNVNSNTQAMKSELACVCQKWLALNNDAFKKRHTNAYAHTPQRVTSSVEAIVAMATGPLCTLSSVAAMLGDLHLRLFSFLSTLSHSSSPVPPSIRSRAGPWCSGPTDDAYLLFFIFCRMPARHRRNRM